jgi:hypothetical protein
MPELLTQPITPESPAQVAGIKSEWWPASNRNGGRHQIGIPGRLPSESTGSRSRTFNDRALELEFRMLRSKQLLSKTIDRDA